jgi:hypothetical protein
MVDPRHHQRLERRVSAWPCQVAQGTPEDIARVARSYTGQFLKPVLGRRENKRKKGVQAVE